jgi:DNA-binding response OmpR family regulator
MKKKVLVVAEHNSFRQLLGVYLSDKFETAVVRDNLDAMIWLQQGNQPDLIVSANERADSGMLPLLQSSGFFSRIPVLVLENMEQDNSSLWLKRGARAYLPKPFNPLQLQEHISLIIH